MSNQSTPTHDGWPVAHFYGAAIQNSPLPHPATPAQFETNALWPIITYQQPIAARRPHRNR